MSFSVFALMVAQCAPCVCENGVIFANSSHMACCSLAANDAMRHRQSTCDPLLYPKVAIAGYNDDDGFNKLKTICLVCHLAGLCWKLRRANDNVAENKVSSRQR